MSELSERARDVAELRSQPHVNVNGMHVSEIKLLNDLAAAIEAHEARDMLVAQRLFLLHCHPETLRMVVNELMFGFTLEFDQYGHPISATPPPEWTEFLPETDS